MTPRDTSKYGSPLSALDTLAFDFVMPSLPSLPEMEWRPPPPRMTLPALPSITLPDFSRPADCHHCGAPSPGKRCRFCGTGEAPELPPDACPSCRSHIEATTLRDVERGKTLLVELCNCPTVNIYEVPECGAARLVETKPNPRFYQAVLDDSGKTIGYTTRKGGA